MESTIYIAEATALIQGIHVLKQWIYDGTAQLLVPSCTLTAVEEAYKLSIIPKDAPKQQQTRQSGKPTRKEQPLFDINPRTTWEFIQRARSDNGVAGVTFQNENENFTQWKDEEAKAAKAETPLPPPSSFADALLRKLAVKEEKDEVKAPSKPKLTARTKDNKPAWKIEKVPTVSSSGFSESNKSLFSCVFWFVYEAEKNPLQPVKYVLLANKEDVREKAASFGVATSTVNQIQEQLLKDQKQCDTRNANGELEQQFPEILAMSKAFSTGSADELDDGPADLSFLDSQAINQGTNPPAKSHISRDSVKIEAAPDPPEGFSMKADDTSIPHNHVLDSSQQSFVSSAIADKPNNNNENENEVTATAPAQTDIVSTNTAVQNISHEQPKPNSPKETSATEEEMQAASDSSTELDSDEEIIVFNPRNKRTSGLAGSNSRPGSSGGIFQKTYKAGIQTNSRPNTSAGMTSLDGQIESMLTTNGTGSASRSPQLAVEKPAVLGPGFEPSLKAPMESKLKAQSPVFTPGQPFIPSPVGISSSTGVLQISPIPNNGPSPPIGPRLPNARTPRNQVARGDNGQELLRIQKENSQRIIQRQREAIQRQSKALEPDPEPAEPSSPRLIQMEPTDNPTIIDPDAFDRSYIVQSPSKPSPRQAGEKRRSKGNRRNAKDLPKESSKQNGHVVEPDVEYVLKSGTPRGSTRGKGKLWTP